MRSGGDRNGKGSASVTFDGTQLCWGITVAGNVSIGRVPVWLLGAWISG